MPFDIIFAVVGVAAGVLCLFAWRHVNQIAPGSLWLRTNNSLDDPREFRYVRIVRVVRGQVEFRHVGDASGFVGSIESSLFRALYRQVHP